MFSVKSLSNNISSQICLKT